MKEYIQPTVRLFSTEPADILTVSIFGATDYQNLDEYDVSIFFN